MMVLQQALIWMTLGVSAGLFGAATLSRFLTSQLFEVSPTNPLIYASLTSLLLTVAIIATSIPAMRASKVDPIVALRYE
jgi:putative ABC transport system permease protein